MVGVVRRIAGRQWWWAVLVAVVLAGSVGSLTLWWGSATDRAGSVAPRSSTATTALPSRTPDDIAQQGFYRLAAAASDATLASFRPPPSSVELDGKPAGWFAGGIGSPQSDPTLTRVSWWSTSLSPDAVGRYLDHATPSLLTAQQFAGGSSSMDGTTTWERSYEIPGHPVYVAYSSPQLDVAFESVDGRTYLEVISYETARYVVPGRFRIDEPITSARIDRTKTTGGSATPVVTQLAPVTLRPPQGAQRLARLVEAYNGLPGTYTVPMASSCPAIRATVKATVTFTSASGHVWVAEAESGCASAVQVSADGASWDRRLDGSAWFSAVDAALGAAAPGS